MAKTKENDLTECS